jgi:hypothetical protein
MKSCAFFAAILISVSILGCATTNEPQAHVEECHVRDGMLLDKSSCVADHEKIVVEREAKTAKRRVFRSSDRGTRL